MGMIREALDQIEKITSVSDTISTKETCCYAF